MSSGKTSFLKQVQSFNLSKPVEVMTQITFLAYYLMLGVYAIINILLLTQAFNLSPMMQVSIAVGCTLSAIMNEYIDMMVTVERETHDEVRGKEAAKRRKTNAPYLSMYLMIAAVATSLALGHYFLTTYNMIWLQLASYNVPKWVENTYYGMFIGSAVVGFGLTFINSFFKYINHVLLPGLLPSQANGVSTKLRTKSAHAKKKKANKQIVKQEKTKTLIGRVATIIGSSIRGFFKSSIQAAQFTLRAYLTSPLVTAVGALTGAALYGLGDFSQMYGLLFYLTAANIVVIPAAWQLGLSLSFALNTILERNSIWGYNFNHYVEMHAQDDKKLKKEVSQNSFIQAIKFDHPVRRVLANVRLTGVFILNILGACLHFRGWFRLLGMATSAGYYVSQRAQMHFQTRKGKDELHSTELQKGKANIKVVNPADQEDNNETKLLLAMVRAT